MMETRHLTVNEMENNIIEALRMLDNPKLHKIACYISGKYKIKPENVKGPLEKSLNTMVGKGYIKTSNGVYFISGGPFDSYGDHDTYHVRGREANVVHTELSDSVKKPMEKKSSEI